MTPNALYRAVQAGGNAKAFLLALHKRNTGKLVNNTEEINLKDIKLEKHVADMPTMMMPSIPKSPDLSTNELVAVILTPQGIYKDQEGRQCFKLIDVSAHTIDLVDRAVERFYKLTGGYPVEIITCPSRYVLLRFKDFCPSGGSPIPYVRDFVRPIDYDVLVRGRK